jgi:hypothetical protein
MMADVLIRGLSDESLAKIDQAARDRGLSRNEFLRRQLSEQDAQVSRPRLTREDLLRASSASEDLLNDEIMSGAWR